MRHSPGCQFLASALLVAGGFCLFGCSAAGQRNLKDSVFVTAAPPLAEDDVKFVLELRDRREEFALSELEAFMASERAANLSGHVRSQVRERSGALRRTLTEARKGLGEGVAIIRPDLQRAYADGNIVVYLAGKSGVHVLFSCAEIGQLLAFHEIAEDLATIRYTHPAFHASRLLALRDRLSALGLNVPNLAFSASELEGLKTAAATRILERYLRESGLALVDRSPLLTSGPFTPMHSPKLTEAFKAPSVLEQLLQSHNTDALRALIFLVDRKVIELNFR